MRARRFNRRVIRHALDPRRLTGVTDAANNVTTIGYDLLGRKTGMTDPDMGSWQYGYDNAGNLTSQRDGANRWLYLEYDALNRLIRKRQDSAAGAILAEWLYDATGQLGLPSKSLAYSSQGTTEAYTIGYDVLNRPLQQQYTVPGAGGGTFRLDTTYNAYGYDAVGNQTNRTIAGTAYTQSFDYDNRLLGVAGGSVNAMFLYDADGNRVKGTVDGVTTVYLAGLYEYQNGATTKYYEGGAIRRTGYATDNGVFYTLSDQLRSTSVLVNQNGTVKDRNYYYPYGGNRGGSAFTGITTKRFTGQYHEQGLPGGEGLSVSTTRAGMMPRSACSSARIRWCPVRWRRRR